jgi:CubicO group peptidase (beta-lactamase class C family)
MTFSFNTLESAIIHLMEDQKITGLAMAIVKDDAVLYSQGFGVTSMEEGGVPVTPDTLFRIGSTSKPMTGTLVMRLVEQGLLDLDAPIKTYLPDFHLQDSRVEDTVTVRHFLSHSSGLPSDFSEKGSRDPEGLARHIREDFPRYKQIAPPGKVFCYSNPGINLCGRVAEAVTGKPYAQLMREMVFDPLEMKRSTFDLPSAMTYPVALAHLVGDDGRVHVDHQMIDNSAYNPSGLGFSSANDLANFAMLHLNAGEFHDKQLLSPASIAAMHTIQTPIYSLALRGGVESYQRMGYGLTFFVAEMGATTWVSHAGGIQSYVVFFELVPNQGAACILLANGGGNGLEASAIIDPIFSGVFSIPTLPSNLQPVEPERALWASFEGIYQGDNGLVKISSEDWNLSAEINGENIKLESLAPNFYFGKSKPEEKKHHSLGFIPEDEGPVQYLVADGNIFNRNDHFALLQLSAEEMGKYVGVFHNGIHGDIEISLKDGQLFLRLMVIDRSEPYIALDGTHFTGSFGPLVFDLDAVGLVRSFRINDSFTFEKVN